MSKHEHSNVRVTLNHWITFLCAALPSRSACTFLELLFGLLLGSNGFVTSTLLCVQAERHWTTYYKWLEKGKWCSEKVLIRFHQLLMQLYPARSVEWSLDDTVCLRASKKAPDVVVHHQHGNKPNQAKYVTGQGWVTLTQTVFKQADSVSVPLRSATATAGETGKLKVARELINTSLEVVSGCRVRLLIDAWYMKYSFLSWLFEKNIDVIGQVRIDTRLCDAPEPKKKKTRGAPRKYGRAYSKNRIQALKREFVCVNIYGKMRRCRLRSAVVQARFLKGRMVRVVWCEIEHEKRKDEWSPTKLILSTETSLTPSEIIIIYARRWKIESVFNEMKNSWGLKNAWQQQRETLLRWVHLIHVAYGITQLLRFQMPTAMNELTGILPWRKKVFITNGLMRTFLQMNIQGLKIRDCWDKNAKIFRLDECNMSNNVKNRC